MKAYMQGIPKEQFLKEIKLHQKMDNFIKGTYNQGRKGCAVGCSIKSINKITKKRLRTSNHKLYEQYLGVPEWLARVQDVIFEHLPEERSKIWPVEFTEAINEGAELDNIKVPFIVFILENNIETMQGLLTTASSKEIRTVVKQSIEVNKQMITAQVSGDPVLIEEAWSAARSARSAACSAAWSTADSAAWSAAESARSAAESARSATESAAWSTADSAAWSATESAAESAADSARSAAWSAAESAAWSASESAAWSAAYEKYADKLLKLIREEKGLLF